MDLDRAKAISSIAKDIIDTGRLEVEFMRFQEEATGSKFFDDVERADLDALDKPRAMVTLPGSVKQ